MKRYIIIGGGAAGISAAEAIRKTDNDGLIEVISREDVLGYNRPMLTKSMSKEFDVRQIVIKEKEWYDDNKIELSLVTAVESIAPDVTAINLSDGSTKFYDRLIIATGADCFLPKAKGSDLDGVFTIRTYGNIIDIKNRLCNGGRAVVIGGGILGIEAAGDLSSIADKVTILERSNGLMSKQLDDKGSEHLREVAEKRGIDVMLKAELREVVGDGQGNVRGVFLESGEEIPADIVIFSTGVVPNIALAKDAGLDIGRSIKVDECCLTSKDNIYAVGDCAEFEGKNFGILTQALEMGRVAGINAATDSCNEKYSVVVPSNMYNGMGTVLFSIGDNGKNPEREYEVIESGGDERLYYTDGTFVGAVVTGSLSKVPKIIEGYKTGKYDYA